MLLKELKERIDLIVENTPILGECEVVVPLSQSSLGPMAATSITRIWHGIDWDSGRIFLGTKDSAITGEEY